uniref:Putative guanine nucleotide exchange factor n=1 Tax=Xenopsylla cheopis TaxID=163159 RepID=A0A6M2DLT5_XENCH
MDDEIQETVESILGKGVKVVDCEKKSSIREEEVLLINGCPVTLEGEDGAAIKQAMLTGQVPPCDLLNQILVRAGILRAPVRLETSLSVKSSVVTREEVTVARGGQVVDERSRETKEDNYYTSSSSEVWEPIKVVPANKVDYTNGKDSYIAIPLYNKNATPHNTPADTSSETSGSRPTSNASTSDSGSSIVGNTNGVAHLSQDSGHELSSSTVASHTVQAFRLGNSFTPTSMSSIDSTDENDTHFGFKSPLTPMSPNCDVDADGYSVPVFPSFTPLSPTIFGTVTSDQCPKDASSRRSLPQTPRDGKSFSVLFSSSPGSAGDHLPGYKGSESFADDGLDVDNALVYRDGNLVSGSLEALVQHTVPTGEYYPDRAYLFAFLLSARLFIKPHELLAKVCALCDAQQHLDDACDIPAHQRDTLGRFVPHLVQLLAEWTETFPYDFRDERVMQHVRSMTQKCINIDPCVRKEVSALLQNLLHRLTTLEKYEDFLKRLSDNTNTSIESADITELCPSPGTLAQQLTHIELERLSYIGPEEFVQAFAKETPHLETSFKDMKKTRNLESYVQWFNRLSHFVATEVCKHAKKKQRVRVVEYWIEAARESFNIGNFNSLMAIIAGLNMSPISRLKKTWSKIQPAKFSILEHQMDPSSNFSSYRSTLKAAMWRSAGATDERQRIVIPFFSLLVKDLYFLNEGCSNKLPNGHINFEKFWQLAKQVTEFITWKQVTCPFEKNAKVLTFLQSNPVLSENALALASFECEPPENNHEKDRYKALKSELNS